MTILSDSEQDQGERGPPNVLTINKDYAKKYQERKQREELSKLQEKYQSSDDSDVDSESDVEEDETGELLTPAIDAQILNTISAIKAHDPSVYDKERVFFDSKELAKREKEWKKNKRDKKLTLLQYQHEQTATGKVEEEGDEEDFGKPKTYQQEQDDLKKEFQQAIGSQEHNNRNNECDDLLLIKKTKSSEQVKREEEEYRKFLLENLAKNEHSPKTHMSSWLQENQENLDPDERFLVNFVLNRGWVDPKGSKKQAELEAG